MDEKLKEQDDWKRDSGQVFAIFRGAEPPSGSKRIPGACKRPDFAVYKCGNEPVQRSVPWTGEARLLARRFGDYFKRDAIAFAWELVTSPQWFGMPKDRLYVTIFREDDEAEKLWSEVAGVPRDRIFRLDEKDNFWQMGETGPCGPCSEIHFDLGPCAAEKGREHEQFPSDAGGRYVELWN